MKLDTSLFDINQHIINTYRVLIDILNVKWVHYFIRTSRSIDTMARQKFWKRVNYVAGVLLALGLVVEAIKQAVNVATETEYNEPIGKVIPSEHSFEFENVNESPQTEVNVEGAKASSTIDNQHSSPNITTTINNSPLQTQLLAESQSAFYHAPSYDTAPQLVQEGAGQQAQHEALFAQASSSEEPVERRINISDGGYVENSGPESGSESGYCFSQVNGACEAGTVNNDFSTSTTQKIGNDNINPVQINGNGNQVTNSSTTSSSDN